MADAQKIIWGGKSPPGGGKKSGEQKKVTIKNGSLRELDRGPKIYARGVALFLVSPPSWRRTELMKQS